MNAFPDGEAIDDGAGLDFWPGHRSPSNREAIGTRLTLKTDKHTLVRQCKGSYSYLSSSEPIIHWGIPQSEQIESLEIQWPSGKKQVLKPERNQTLHVVEPRE